MTIGVFSCAFSRRGANPAFGVGKLLGFGGVCWTRRRLRVRRAERLSGHGVAHESEVRGILV